MGRAKGGCCQFVMIIHEPLISKVENVKLLGEYSFGNAFWMIILRFDV